MRVYIWFDSSNTTASDLYFVQTIELRFAPSAKPTIESVDWATFAEAVATLSRLEVFLTRFRHDSEEARAAYMEHAHEHLDSVLRERGIGVGIDELSY